jgi:orotidine-5'-phosphate decarboxylase
MTPDNPIILALDSSELTIVRELLVKVRPHIGMIKIGTELFTAHGREAIELSKQFSIPIFLDLKLHDIPTTVGKTVSVICDLLATCSGEHFLSIHCMGGSKMCQMALEAAQGSNVIIAGVTVLTSITKLDFSQMGFKDCRSGSRTISAVEMVLDQGMRTFICAPNQLKLMSSHFKDITMITPGIRAKSSDDHVRSKPISFALKNGATWVVIGRPITQALLPGEAALNFKKEVERYK